MSRLLRNTAPRNSAAAIPPPPLGLLTSTAGTIAGINVALALNSKGAHHSWARCRLTIAPQPRPFGRAPTAGHYAIFPNCI